MDIAFARRLIAKPGKATTTALFKGVHPGLFWVDWREADDDIVHMLRAAIGAELTTTWNGTRLQIGYRGKTTEVALTAKPGEQDLTLAGLNEALTGQFEIRYVTASEGGDTIAFMALPSKAWAELEAEFGDKVQKRLRRLDPKRPLFGGEQTSKEEVEAQIERANPGMLGSLKLGRAAFRLITTEQADRVRAEHAPSADALPVMRPYCGDLVLTYFNDMLASSDPITEGELRRYNLSDEQLYGLAWKHSGEAWGRFNLAQRQGVGRFFGKERIDNSSFALFGGYWDHQDEETGPLIAAFPRRDLALFARADDAVGIAFLITTIDAVDPASADALSRQLFVRVQRNWQVRPWHDEQRHALPIALATAAARADFAAQYQWAVLHKDCGMPAQAAAMFRAAGDQAEAACINSPDMFINGSALLCDLADLYEHGNGVEQDFAQALDWYQRSAAMNNFVAEYSLGNLHLNGHGVPRDLEQAKYWFQRSAKQGYASAINSLASLEQPPA